MNNRLMNAILSVSRCATLEGALLPLLDSALDLTKMDGGGVYWVEGDMAVLRHHRGLPAAFIQEVTRMPLSPPVVQTVLGLQRPADLAQVSPPMRELMHRHGLRHAFSFPLRAQDTLFGFLNLGSMRPQEPRKADIQALHVLVVQMETLFWRLYCEKALQESEQRYRTLAETARDFIFVAGLDGRVQYVNQYGAAALGSSPEELIGRKSSELFPLETPERHTESLQNVIESGEPLSVVVPSSFQDRELWLAIQLTPIRGATGELQSVLGIARDITRQKQLEQELRRLNERLELQVAQRTEELLHRARQLQRLTAELTQAEEQERERLAEFLHDDLQQVLAAARFRLGLLSRHARGNKEILEIIGNVGQMLQEAMEKSRDLSHELAPPALYHGTLNETFEWLVYQMDRKHALTVHLDMQRPIDSNSDTVRSLLYRASQELLFNVVKHAGVREAELRLQRAGDELQLAVSDGGRGFDPAAVSETVGFGLFSIRERVELLGGRMNIDSAPGRGSRLQIVLPDAASAHNAGSA